MFNPKYAIDILLHNPGLMTLQSTGFTMPFEFTKNQLAWKIKRSRAILYF